MKQLLCLILCAAMLIGCIAPVGYAAEISSDADVVAQTGDVSIEAANGIGSLLSAEITEVEEESSATELSAHVITDVVVENSIAKVSYFAEDYATVVVALYSEDGLRLLSSTSGEATPDASEVELSFQGDMPEYFLVRAYMMDSVDCTPLSEMYETPIYTQSMQELLDSTITDYDPDLVVNFDDDPTTNFAVYNEGVVIVDEVDGVNIVTTNDDENLLYVIENADEIFTSLQSGDIVSYFYDEDQLLLCKVASVAAEGSTVTICGDENITLEDVFSHMKVQNEGNTNDFTAADSSTEDNCTVVESYSPTTFVNDVDFGGELEKAIKFKFVGDEWKSKNGEKVKISGSVDLEFKVGLEFEFLYTNCLKHLSLKVDYDIQIVASFEGSADIYLADFSDINSDGIAAFKIRFSPKFIVRLSGEVEAAAGLSGSIGFDYTDTYGIQNLCTKPVLKCDVELEGSVFFGWDFHPEAFSVHEKFLKLDLSVPLGYTIRSKLSGSKYDGVSTGIAPSVHECEVCWDGNRFFGIELEPCLTFLDNDRWSISKKYVLEFSPVHFYDSKTFDEKGDGECPHKQYLVTFEVKDNNKNPVEAVEIQAADANTITNDEGVAYLYLPSGRHNVIASYNGQSDSWSIQVNEGRAKLKLIFGDDMFYFSEFIDESLLDHLADESMLEDSGYCGDNVTWSYYENGTLIIEGTGPMYDIDSIYSRPWPYSLGQVIIRDGVTHIGANAFNQVNLRRLYLPTSLTSIGAGAFASSNLANLVIPNGVVSVGNSAFAYCNYLQTVVIPDSVTNLGTSMFMHCPKLTEVTLSDSLTIIPENTFYECAKLSQVDIPEGVLTVDIYAFYKCTALSDLSLPSTLKHLNSRSLQDTESLMSINLPDGLQFIGERTFCNSGLESVYIPDSVTTLREAALSNCENLTSVHLPSGITVIKDSMFFGDSSLVDVVIPESVTTIEYWAFNQCTALTSIVIPDSVTTLAWGAFSGCKKLSNVRLSENLDVIEEDVFYNCGFTSIDLPDSIQRIGPSAFEQCINLKTIEISESVTTIGYSAFWGCISLEYIEIPDNVMTIGSDVFADCSSLTSVKLSESLTEIPIRAFSKCISLVSLDIPNGVTEIESCAFDGCTNLVTVNLPETLLYLGDHAFSNCSSLQNICIPSMLTKIPNYCFINCDGLTIIEIPGTIQSIGLYAYSECDNLGQIWFMGDGPNYISYAAFKFVTANAYYPGDVEYWYPGNLSELEGNLTWYPYYYDEDGNIIIGEATLVPTSEGGNPETQLEIVEDTELENTEATESLSEEVAVVPETPSHTLDAFYGGEYGAEDMGDYIQRTASFSGLMPGEEYVMLSLVNIDTDQPVAPENLLYIAQAEAGEDGNLSFTYVQRVTTDPSYVVLCGPATKTLADAQITVPEYYTDGELHVVNPNVVYDGETLLEGRDYEITGQVCFTEAGTYTCFIRGIHNYTGTMQCVYTVGEWNCDENGHDFEDGFCRYCDEEDPDAQPTEPTEPSDPTDPSEPIDPTEPTEPSDPSEPTEPAGEGVIRLSGANRYATGFAVADQLKENLSVESFEAVVVAYGQNFPDALTGSYLAAVKNAPILLTEKSVDHTVAAYIDENLVSGGTVYILGGAAAVSESFENALRSRGFAVKRLKGAERYETNLAILKEAGVNTTDEVLIATGKNYADSLSASATGLPMLLVDKELSEAQKAFLETTSGKFVIIGGTGAVSADVEAELDAMGDVTRVKGANRYGTSVEIAKRYFTDPESAVLAYAQGFPDGLCGGPLALSMDAPLILTSNDSFAAADDYVAGISSGAVTGGTSRISDDTVRAIFDLSPDTPVVKP